MSGRSGLPAQPGPHADKAQWRRWALDRRRRVDPTVRAQRSAAVRAALASWLAERPPATVLLYRAMGAELDLDALATDAGSPHRWATTRTPSTGPLTVHAWDAPAERHRFGFEQPMASAAELAPASIGVALVPGLVFDRTGGRIGYGKGYYDRLLSVSVTAVRIGVVEAAALVERVPVTALDVPMDLLVTEEGIRPVHRPQV